MATGGESPPSDNDGGERPVRKQLKETSIESAPVNANENTSSRKRSFEESRDHHDDPCENGENRRKRSREGTPSNTDNAELNTGKDTSSGAQSLNVSEHDMPNLLWAAPLESAPDTPRHRSSGVPSITSLKDILNDHLDFDAYYGEFIEDRLWTLKNVEIGLEEADQFHANQERFFFEELERLQEAQSYVEMAQERTNEERGSIKAAQALLAWEKDRLERALRSIEEESSPQSPGSGHPASLSPSTPKSSTEIPFQTAQSSPHGCPESPEPWAACLLPGDPHPAPLSNGHFKSRPAPRSQSPPESNLGIFTRDSSVADKSTQTTTTSIQTPPDMHKEIYKQNTNELSQDRIPPTIEPTHETMDDGSAKSLAKKRSLEQLEEDSKKADMTNDSAPSPAGPADAKPTSDGEPEKKKHRDNSQERDTKTDNVFAASAFGKAAASPFASLNKIQDSTTDSQKPSSASAFASSSLAAFAGSESSPFGALGGSTQSVFKTAASGTGSFATPSVFKSVASGANSFAAPSGTSSFGALGSGFTGVGGGFGAAAKAGGLTSFASNNAPVTLGEHKAKPLGAEDSEGDESDSNDEDNTNTFEASKTDERFYAQNIETGEEEEETVFSCKAKLFHFQNKEWKERGIGTFKVNVRQGADGKQTGRMLMRADGAMRVILNGPIFKGMNYGDAKNEAPINKQILLASVEEGRTVPLLLRTGNESYARELYDIIDDLLKDSNA
ncbi:hypothetical protein N7504_011092 [Penicillium tannophilum]|nr:hypothetical protein N7504_011092 [Penicillium tannophilum]